MEDVSMIFKAVYLLILCILASIAVIAVYSYIVYKSFTDAEDAMKAYRSSSTHAFSHIIMRYTILLLSVGFAVWAVLKRSSFAEDKQLMIICAAVLFPVTGADLFILPTAKDTMARMKILMYLISKYNMNGGSINDWYIDLDEDEYPEELELAVSDSGRERSFIIDLEHRLIREKREDEN